jgi:flagellar hook-associated protein 1
MSTLSIGISGLNAANVGLSTTTHNIANASTPGYNRQVIVQGTNIPIQTGAGYLGQGTNVQTVRRIYDQFLSTQVLNAQAGASGMDSYLQEIQQIDNLLANPDAGLSPALAEFFKGVQEVATYPSSIPARQSMLSGAEALAARFQALDQRIGEIRGGVNAQIAGAVVEINSYASQIADINERILLARAGNQLQEPNDLLDQRDQLIVDLNKVIKVSTLAQSDGSLNVFFGNGQPLVVGQQAYTLAARPAAGDPGKTVVTMQATPTTWIELPESQIVGGKLGGLVAFRSGSLDSAQNSLGRIAIALALDFNAQHRLGVDLDGQPGGNVFRIGSPISYSSSLNTGTGMVAASFNATASATLTDSDYQISYTAANTFTMTRLSDGVSWTGTGGTPAAALADLLTNQMPDQGFGVTLSGAPAVGDSFVIHPTRGAASTLGVALTDARDIAAAAPIVTAEPLTNTGTGHISEGAVSSVAGFPLGGTVTLTYAAATNQFVVTGPIAAGPFSYTPGGTISFAGISVTLTGNPADGDRFLINNNTTGVSDNRNATVLANLQTARVMLGGTASYQSAYSQIVSAVGTKTREVRVIGQSQQGLADAAEAERQKISGVNLDEEAGNLIRYQQAYQAAARVIEISNKLFDDLLAAMA